MSPDQELLLAAALLYLFECCIILHRRQLLFWSPGFSRFRIMPPENLPGSYAKAVFIAMPLPPLGEYLIAEPWPFALSPDGVASAPVQRIGRGVLSDVDYATFIPWSGVKDVRINGAVIEISGAAFVTCSGQRAAESCASLIKRIAESPAAKRESRIVAAVESTLDLGRATETYATARESSRYARFIGNALMILVFAVCPLVIAYRGLATTWHVLAMELALVWVFAILEFWFAHRRLYRERKGERRLQMLLRGMTPVGAMRFGDILMRESMFDFHPLVIAKVICGAARFGAFSEDVVRDLRHPLRPADDDAAPEAQAATDWFRARMLSATESALEQWNVDWRSFGESPSPDDETCLGYCPRCRLQHTKTSGDCSNCPGVALVPFAGA